MLPAWGNQRKTLSSFLPSSTQVMEFGYCRRCYHFYGFVCISVARLRRSRAHIDLLMFFASFGKESLPAHRVGFTRLFKRDFRFFSKVSKGIPFFLQNLPHIYDMNVSSIGYFILVNSSPLYVLYSIYDMLFHMFQI